MAALTSIVPSAVGTLAAAAAVSSTDTISQAQLGSNGAFLLVINAGASPDTVAISDSGNTPAGNPGSSSGGTVANATNKVFYINPYAVNPTTGVVTVTHSFTTTVTYYLFPKG
jgi:hypothetical protein